MYRNTEEDALIEVKNLTKRYGDFAAVEDVSFAMEKGRVYGFLGPNGAGKSSTMNIITGCLAATSGSVTIDGLDIYEDAVEAKKKIGYLPELPPVYGACVHCCELCGVQTDAAAFDENFRRTLVR